MFKFLQNNVYKKMFINFSIVFIIIILLFTSLIYGEIYRNRRETLQQNNRYASEYVESVIKIKQNEIDERLAKIYNNDKALNNVVNFFKFDMDEYLSQRLDQYKPFEYFPTINKFAEDCIYNDNSITRVIIYDHIKDRMMIYFSDPIIFLKTWDKADLSQLEESLAEAEGFFIEKYITDPDTLDTLGTIYVTFNPKETFSAIDQFDPSDIVMIYDNSYLELSGEIKSPNVIEHMDFLIGQEKMEGIIPIGAFNKLYYSTQLIVPQNLRVMTFIDTSMLKIDSSIIFLLIAISVAVFIGSELFVARKLGRESNDLDNIVKSINSAKSGHFIPSDVVHRKDELGIVATELNDMIVKLNDYIEREYKLQIEQQQMQFDLLQSQMDPHFLYNTLEILKAKALLNSDAEVAGAISNLGGLYRDLLAFDSVIPLKDELRLAKRYLDMMSFIYDKNFYYTIDVDQSLMTFETIKFWIQALIENFLVHGMDKSSDINILVIRGYRTQDSVIIEVQDNGIGIPPEKLHRINRDIKFGNNNNIGLSNVYERLKLYYGNSVDMNLFNNEQAGITVKIEFKEDRDV